MRRASRPPHRSEGHFCLAHALGTSDDEGIGALGAPRSGGYETLLLEVVRGDQTLFVHADEAEASWRLYGPLLEKRWPLRSYPAGGPGPEGLP